MLQNLFAWLRSSVRDAVLGGVADALEVIDGNGPGIDASEGPSLESIRRRLQPALISAPVTVPASVPAVAVDAANGEPAPIVSPKTNGRRKATTAKE